MKLNRLIAMAFAGLFAMTATALAGPEVNTSTGIVLVAGKTCTWFGRAWF